MKLSEILKNIPVLEMHADGDMEITDVANDSRKAAAGTLFIAVKGYETDGHKFITAAKKQGASCVLCQKRPRCAIPYVLVENSRSAEALAAAAFYGHP
ncbi:MAG: UDP-N-acetylmuramoyl-L-alanyl-D-glutamate--2,6-diaminopimelate ligase, partial [Oscillospiraceae bacterium]|nr:UDP-N-acetylmuramoyl-L-alanyl-D-glutamate--2,6-diaminopimelate ligase [Oscillospiraceae bacterium]